MQGPREPLLPPLDPQDKRKYTLVLDMDGTLLIELTEDQLCANNDERFCDIDFVVEQQITGRVTFIAMRPYLEHFLQSMAQRFEIVIFTESPQRRADAILDKLPNSSLIGKRLYRDSCTEIEGKLVKDLSLLGRDLKRVVIVDDCPFSYSLQPSNSLPIKRFFCWRSDIELMDELPCALAKLALLKVDVTLVEKSPIVSDNFLYWTLPQEPPSAPLLPPMEAHKKKKHTLVLDMDGTLLDYNLDVAINKNDYRDSFKRPGVDDFLEEAAEMFELVIFTASSAKRANRLIDGLFSPHHQSLFSHRLYRNSCLQCCMTINIKDLSVLGRDLRKVILIDDIPLSYELQPFNAIPIKRFRTGDTSDRSLIELIPFLRQLAQEKNDVRPLIRDKYHDLDCVLRAPPENRN